MKQKKQSVSCHFCLLYTTSGWTVVNEDLGKRANINSSNLTNTSTAATYLTSTYKDYRWNRT